MQCVLIVREQKQNERGREDCIKADIFARKSRRSKMMCVLAQVIAEKGAGQRRACPERTSRAPSAASAAWPAASCPGRFCPPPQCYCPHPPEQPWGTYAPPARNEMADCSARWTGQASSAWRGWRRRRGADSERTAGLHAEKVSARVFVSESVIVIVTCGRRRGGPGRKGVPSVL